MLIGGVGLAMLVLVPLVWGLLRREQGLPMFGAPTVAELEDSVVRPEPPSTRARRRRLTADAVHLLDNPIRDYAWGSTTGARGAPRPGARAASPRPSCGSAPTQATRRGCRTADALDDEIRRPAAARSLGPEVAERFGGRLPFLMKVLAVDEVLSLQVHPSSRAGAGRPRPRGGALASRSTRPTAATPTRGTSRSWSRADAVRDPGRRSATWSDTAELLRLLGVAVGRRRRQRA